MAKPKYKNGKLIHTIGEFENCQSLWYRVRFGGKYKTLHYSFLQSWQYVTLKRFITHGNVCVAEKIGEEGAE